MIVHVSQIATLSHFWLVVPYVFGSYFLKASQSQYKVIWTPCIISISGFMEFVRGRPNWILVIYVDLGFIKWGFDQSRTPSWLSIMDNYINVNDPR